MSDRYAAWRASVPFTNEQIADVLLEEADELREQGNEYLALNREYLAAQAIRNRVSRVALRHALPRLVRWCAVCGKTALYRYGSSGRCRAHRLALDCYFERKLKRLDACSGFLEAMAKKRAIADISAERFRRTKRDHK